MTLAELAQLVVVMAAAHRASGAVIALAIVATIAVQRLSRRIASGWKGER